MANAHRGDIDLLIGSQHYTLRLTLQALAEMEAAFGVDDLVALGSRLSAGNLSAKDLIRILGPAVRGGGADKSDRDVAALLPAAELPAIIDTVARLLAATFGVSQANPILPQDV